MTQSFCGVVDALLTPCRESLCGRTSPGQRDDDQRPGLPAGPGPPGLFLIVDLALSLSESLRTEEFIDQLSLFHTLPDGSSTGGTNHMTL